MKKMVYCSIVCVLFILSICTIVFAEIKQINDEIVENVLVILSSIIGVFSALLVVEVDLSIKKKQEKQEHENAINENKKLLDEYLDGVCKYAENLSLQEEALVPKYSEELNKIDLHELKIAPFFSGNTNCLSSNIRKALMDLAGIISEIGILNIQIQEWNEKKRMIDLEKGDRNDQNKEFFNVEKVNLLRLRQSRVKVISYQTQQIKGMLEQES